MAFHVTVYVLPSALLTSGSHCSSARFGPVPTSMSGFGELPCERNETVPDDGAFQRYQTLPFASRSLMSPPSVPSQVACWFDPSAAPLGPLSTVGATKSSFTGPRFQPSENEPGSPRATSTAIQ